MGFGAVVTSRCAGTKGWVPRKMPELWQLLSGWGPIGRGVCTRQKGCRAGGPGTGEGVGPLEDPQVAE